MVDLSCHSSHPMFLFSFPFILLILQPLWSPPINAAAALQTIPAFSVPADKTPIPDIILKVKTKKSFSAITLLSARLYYWSARPLSFFLWAGRLLFGWISRRQNEGGEVEGNEWLSAVGWWYALLKRYTKERRQKRRFHKNSARQRTLRSSWTLKRFHLMTNHVTDFFHTKLSGPHQSLS